MDAGVPAWLSIARPPAQISASDAALIRALSFTPEEAWRRLERLVFLTFIGAVKRLHKHGGIPDRRIPI